MKVYVMAESSVYHANPNCTALTRPERYAQISSAELLSDGGLFYTGGFHAGRKIRGNRRACQRCTVAVASTAKDEGC